MPASLLTEILFRGAFEVVLYGVGYVIGWWVVPVLSFGHYRVEPWDFKRRKKSKSHSRRPLPKQLSADATCLVGFAVLAAASTLVYFVWRAAGA